MKRINLFELTAEELSEILSQRIIEELKKLLPVKESNDFITRREAADILRISLPTLRAWTTSGRLKSYRISSRIRYRKSEIITSLQQLPYRRTN